MTTRDDFIKPMQSEVTRFERDCELVGWHGLFVQDYLHSLREIIYSIGYHLQRNEKIGNFSWTNIGKSNRE